MTPNEFKAWFDGFCECIDGAPTDEQFEKIKAKVKQVQSAPVFPLTRGFDKPATWSAVAQQIPR